MVKKDSRIWAKELELSDLILRLILRSFLNFFNIAILDIFWWSSVLRAYCVGAMSTGDDLSHCTAGEETASSA